MRILGERDEKQLQVATGECGAGPKGMRSEGAPNDEKQTIYSHYSPNGWEQVVTYAVIWRMKEGPQLLLCPGYTVILMSTDQLPISEVVLHRPSCVESIIGADAHTCYQQKRVSPADSEHRTHLQKTLAKL